MSDYEAIITEMAAKRFDALFMMARDHRKLGKMPIGDYLKR